MYFVGIDISKFKHDCAIIDDLGNVVAPSWSFCNDCEGFSLLAELLTSLGKDIKIGFASTGHYGQNLKLFLESNSFTFMEFNPLLISRFVRSKSLRKTKTDSIDALIIAQYLMTVGHSDDYLFHQMDILLARYSQLDFKIKEIAQQIAACIRDINPPILSIPGIGALSAAIILSEYGDLSKYDSPAKWLSFAGLAPGYFQSGQSEYTGHMVKHGSSHLRYALMNCCLPLTTNEPVFAAYYAKKRSEGKPHRVDMTHVAKKLLRVIYTLQTKNVSYDHELIR